MRLHRARPTPGRGRRAGLPPPHGHQPVATATTATCGSCAAAPSDRQPDGEPPRSTRCAATASGSVADAVRALPTRQRDCIVLRFYADLTDAEIADTLGISAGSVEDPPPPRPRGAGRPPGGPPMSDPTPDPARRPPPRTPSRPRPTASQAGPELLDRIDGGGPPPARAHRPLAAWRPPPSPPSSSASAPCSRRDDDDQVDSVDDPTTTTTEPSADDPRTTWRSSPRSALIRAGTASVVRLSLDGRRGRTRPTAARSTDR